MLIVAKQYFGINYFEIYAPVVTWFAVQLLIIFTILFKWVIKQVDFVMAYAQDPIKTDVYIDLPHRIETKYVHSKDYFLKLTKNIYAHNQAGRVWNQYLLDKSLSISFHQSLVDEFGFWRGTTIFLVYVDDDLVLDMKESCLTKFSKEL